MSKTTALPKLEDYKAPWEVDSTGADVPDEEQTVDKGRLKKYLHGLLTDKDRLQTTVTTVTSERDAAKAAADEKAREGETADQAAKRETEKAIADARAEGGLEALKLEVALDIEGITPKQAKRLAKRLSGKTREELAEDAEGLVEDFEIGKKVEAPSDEDENETEDDPVAQAARRPTRLRAAGDPDPTATDLPAADRKTTDELFPRR